MIEEEAASGAPASAMASPRSRTGFNVYVQGGRGLFAFFVFIFHIVNSHLPTFSAIATGWGNDVLRSTEYGVELFFCISGFAIATSLGSRRSLPQFVCDRAIRIYPVLWATLVVLVPLEAALHKTVEDASTSTILISLPANMLALPGILPLPLIHPAAWSLSYEMTFYAVAAVTVVVLRRFGGRAAWWFGIAAALAGSIAFPRAAFFACGVLALQPAIVRRIPRLVAGCPELWFAISLAAWHKIQLLSPRHIMFYTLADWVGDERIVLTVIAFAAATIGFVGLTQGRGLLGRLLRSRIALYFGLISYSLYLWHPVVLAVTKHILLTRGIVAWAGPWSQLVFLALSLPASVVFAAVSQHFLERRVGGWLRSRLASQRLHGPRAAPTLVDPARERYAE